MAYGTPSDPVGGTVITVAYAVANILDPLRWLRLLTGNADPPGSSYVVVSTSTSGTSWMKLPGDALAAGAVATHLGYTPANASGQVFTGSVVVPSTFVVAKLDDLGNGGRLLLAGSSILPSASIDNTNELIQFYNLSDPTKIMAFSLLTGGLSLTGAIAAASAAIAGAVTAASAALTGAFSAASAAIAGAVTVGGTLGVTGTSTLGVVNASGAVTSSGLVKGTQHESTVPTGTPPLVVASTTTVPNLRVATAVAADTATTATSAASATNATTAANATALGGVAAASYARSDAATNFTVAPTIVGAFACKIAAGSYTGNGSATQDITLAFSPNLVLIKRAGSSTWIAMADDDAIQINVGSSNGFDTIDLAVNKFVASTASGTNTNAVSYSYVAFGG